MIVPRACMDPGVGKYGIEHVHVDVPAEELRFATARMVQAGADRAGRVVHVDADRAAPGVA
eukprot:CAMPEP_0197465684 /NCGR_PEP_ID=MMETSP1175-20131217/64665_1 /TAXON_ID=1003142 /ORGANISM="Triceratium dubium, Strain CCMP147" /LENGTH=60 /DNA_ID=CAMNT_0043001703 /DNA_START=1149 /DNA_END=1327 /DNA_ORIENTATION=-